MGFDDGSLPTRAQRRHARPEDDRDDDDEVSDLRERVAVLEEWRRQVDERLREGSEQLHRLQEAFFEFRGAMKVVTWIVGLASAIAAVWRVWKGFKQ